uniref:RNA helicase n=1 Tax=Panagrellus redivivus TaxID=6233 RepID=A0A7E4V9Q6_PANRE
MAYVAKEKGEFYPYQKWYIQPRSPSDIHAYDVDPNEFNNVPETFESAKKLISDFARTEIHHFENLAIHPLGRNVVLQEYWYDENNKTWATFNVQEIGNTDFLKRKKLVLFESQPGKFFTSHIDRFDFKNNKLTVTIVDNDLFMKLMNKPLNLYTMVNYLLFANQLKSLDRIAASNDVIQKLAYDTPMIDNDNTAFENKYGRMQLSAALNFPMLDKEQEFAVQQMTRHSNTTFVLTGPTGTGKTVTLLKTVLQLVQSGGRIMVATTKNSAADAFTQGLIDHGFKDKNLLVRLVKGSYDGENLSEEAKAVVACEIPNNVHQMTVVILTVGYGFKLQLADRIMFSHIIVENAHEVPEVDIWTCLSMFGLQKETRLILAGDPELPGPHNLVSNIYSSNTFFKRSMLKRLYNSNAFRQHPALMVTLTANHRSHPDIVNAFRTLSSYRSSMIPARHMSGLDFPKGFNYPLTFCNVSKTEESDSNPAEAEIIAKYVEILTKTVPKIEIGIIAAGRPQQNLHEQMLTNTGIKLGTAYLFCGFERRVILFAAQCCGETLDHLIEPGYLNLVLSRATDLIVLVGNAAYLEKLDEWKTLINICKINNAFREESVVITPAAHPPPLPKPEPYLPPAKRQQRTPSNASQRRYQTDSSNSPDVSAQVLRTMEAMGQQFKEMSQTVHVMSQKFQVVTSSVAALAQEQSKMVQPKDFEHRRSLMIFGMPESRSVTPSARIEDDRKKLAQVFDAMNIEVTPVSIYRIPSIPPSDPRAPARRLTVIFANDRDRYIVFGNMHKLRDHAEFGRIIIDPARTKEELEHFRQCKHIIKQVREHGNDDMVFYCNRLCTRSENYPVKLCREEFLELCEKYPLPGVVESTPTGSEPYNE